MATGPRFTFLGGDSFAAGFAARGLLATGLRAAGLRLAGGFAAGFFAAGFFTAAFFAAAFFVRRSAVAGGDGATAAENAGVDRTASNRRSACTAAAAAGSSLG